MQVTQELWQRLIQLIRNATPDDARPTLSKDGDTRPIPVSKWLPEIEPQVRAEFARLILEANRHSAVEPSPEATEFIREAWTAAIAEIDGGKNEPEYKIFKRPGVAERAEKFRLQDDLERAKSAAEQLQANLELAQAERSAAQAELDSLKRRGFFARLLNR